MISQSFELLRKTLRSLKEFDSSPPVLESPLMRLSQRPNLLIFLRHFGNNAWHDKYEHGVSKKYGDFSIISHICSWTCVAFFFRMLRGFKFESESKFLNANTCFLGTNQCGCFTVIHQTLQHLDSETDQYYSHFSVRYCSFYINVAQWY